MDCFEIGLIDLPVRGDDKQRGSTRRLVDQRVLRFENGAMLSEVRLLAIAAHNWSLAFMAFVKLATVVATLGIKRKRTLRFDVLVAMASAVVAVGAEALFRVVEEEDLDVGASLKLKSRRNEEVVRFERNQETARGAGMAFLEDEGWLKLRKLETRSNLAGSKVPSVCKS